MTPAEYEARCAEMPRANAHNMTPDEMERMAYGAGCAVSRSLVGALTDALAEADELFEETESLKDRIRDIEEDFAS